MTRSFIFAGYHKHFTLREAMAQAEQEFPGYVVVGGREMASYWSLILEKK
jgi:hypothetical protein